MNGLVELLEAAADVQQFFSNQRWRFCFIGGVAVQRWGNPRFTQDIDLTLITGFGSEERFIDSLLTRLAPRRADAREFALRNRVLLLRTASGVDVDVALGALPFEERSIQRATSWAIPDGHRILTCSAEDLVVHKVFAGRARDWDDLTGVLARQVKSFNWEIVRDELPPLLDLKGNPEALQTLESLKANVERRLASPL